jgi:hypothetical protein
MGSFTSLLAAEGDKHSPIELGVLVLLPILLAFVLHRYAKGRVEAGAPRWQLWAALVPLLVGVLLAYGAFEDVSKASYREFHFLTPRAVMLHYAAFFVPVAATVLTIGLILYSNHREKMER